MEQRRLEELLKSVDIYYVSNKGLFKKYIVKSISTDTRSLKKGELFIALKGEKYDAIRFVNTAVEFGSTAVLFEINSFEDIKKVINNHLNVLFIGVHNTLNAYSVMAKNYLDGFRNLRKLAITGSCGKTTMRGLAASVLSEGYKTVSSKKSYNNLIGVSKTIFSISNEHEFYIQEMGTNHPGEINGLVSIVNPDAGLITNIGPAHIGYFGSIENIAREKKSLLLGLRGNDIAFVNKDDSFAEFLGSGIEAEVIFYGIGGNEKINIKSIELNRSVFSYEGNEIVLKLPGRHNIINAVGAISVGTRFGIPIDKIKKALEGYNPEEGRGFLIEVGGVIIIDESYNANPLSVKASIDYLSELKCEGKKIFIFGDMAELGEYSEKYHREVVNYLENTNIDFIFTIGRETLSTYEEAKNRIVSELNHYYDTESLVEDLIKRLSKGDIVLVKGSRFMNLDRLIDDIIQKLKHR